MQNEEQEQNDERGKEASLLTKRGRFTLEARIKGQGANWTVALHHREEGMGEPGNRMSQT